MGDLCVLSWRNPVHFRGHFLCTTLAIFCALYFTIYSFLTSQFLRSRLRQRSRIHSCPAAIHSPASGIPCKPNREESADSPRR